MDSELDVQLFLYSKATDIGKVQKRTVVSHFEYLRQRQNNKIVFLK